jgi:hypothetical protein
MGYIFRMAAGPRLPRHVAPARKFSSRPRRSSLMSTACDLASEVYHPTRTDKEVYVCDIAADVRVALGERICDGKRYGTVAFCGTESLNDWAYNLMLWMVGQEDGLEGHVHAGFCRKWKAVSVKVTTALKRLGCVRVLVTGHSLGGALSTIACIDIARTLPNVEVTAYTFGSPRCADERFHAAPVPRNLKKFVRCVHVGDIVHMFPPFPGYAHPTCAEVVTVGRASHALVQDACDRCTHVLWQQLLRAWRGRLRLEHHQMFSYRRAITVGDIG